MFFIFIFYFRNLKTKTYIFPGATDSRYIREVFIQYNNIFPKFCKECHIHMTCYLCPTNVLHNKYTLYQNTLL